MHRIGRLRVRVRVRAWVRVWVRVRVRLKFSRHLHVRKKDAAWQRA